MPDRQDSNSDSSGGSRVPGTEDLRRRLEQAEVSLGSTSELLAYALRQIRELQEEIRILNNRFEPILKDQEVKKDAIGLEKLRNDLFGILQEQHKKTGIDGIYVKSLYGPNGRPGGKLNISKVQAFRLRDACRSDRRFKVEKAENIRGNWTVRLNLYIS